MKLIRRFVQRRRWRKGLCLWLAAWLLLGPSGAAGTALAQSSGQAAPFPQSSGQGPSLPQTSGQEGDILAPQISSPVLTIVQPVNGSVITTRTPKIAIAFNDGRLGLDVSTLRVMINGADRTALFEVTTSGATLQAKGDALQDGQNVIVATIKNKAGMPAAVSSAFVVDTRSGITVGGMPKGPIGQAFVSAPDTPPALTRDPSGPGLPVLSRGLAQFGYDNFSSPVSTFAPVSDPPVGPEYVLGPGDVPLAHTWGSVESTFAVPITRNGDVILPKAGTITLAGLTFQDAQKMIHQQISRYYSGYQLSVTMGSLRTVRVYAVGEITRPGAYNVSSPSSVSNVLYSVGGPSKLGSLRNIKVIRHNQTIATIDLYDFHLKGERRDDIALQLEDTILVPPIGRAVGVTGYVERPAIYELKGETTLADILEMAGGIMAGGSLSRIQIERVDGNARKELLDVDLTRFYAGKDPGANLPLRNGDLVKVFPIDTRMYNTVSLTGFVGHPGEYELKPGMRLGAALKRDQVLPEAYLDRVEVVRLKPDWTWEVVPVNARQLFQGDASQDIELRPLDKINVGSEARGPITMTLSGEFKVPGQYTVIRGERLSSVTTRAGGYTDDAFLKGAVFIRESVRKVQQQKLDEFVKTQEARLLAENASVEAPGVTADEARAERENVNQRREVLRLAASQVVPGRVVVKLDAPEKMKGGPYDIELEDGDSITVPRTPAAVLVIGSVRVPTAVTWQQGRDVDYYLNQSGGLTKDADKSVIYIVTPDGSAVASFVRVRDVDPGDVIMAPPSTETHIRWRPLIRDIAQIFGSMALGIAGLHAITK